MIVGAVAENTIVVVDDDPVTCGMVKQSLKALGRDVVIAQDGQIALNKLGIANRLPLGVLTDLKMPQIA